MKTRFGVSVNAMAALVCFMALFGSYIPVLLLVGYIMIAEDNEYLKRIAAKALAVMVCFSLLGVVIGYIPNVIELINRVCAIFNGSFYVGIISKLISLITYILGILESLILLVMGIEALSGKNFPVGMIDKFMAANVGTKACKKCGTNVPDGTQFCPNCGEKID